VATVEHEDSAVDDAAVFDWRFGALLRAGYAPAEAWPLATSRDVDVRLAERLLSQGCPSTTAIRILL
jgi:hypothetical protein